MDAAGVTRRTIWVWIGFGLLPSPVKVSQGNPGGVFNRFPASAVERARFIAAKRDEGLTREEILALVTAEGLEGGRPARSGVRPRGVAPPSNRPPERRGAGTGARTGTGRDDRLHGGAANDEPASRQRKRRGKLGRERK